jgi:hypothetical protein
MGHEAVFNVVAIYIYSYDKDLEQKLSRFLHMCGTTQRMLKNKTRKDTQFTFYKVIAVSMLMCGSENWALNRSKRRKN